MNDILRSLSDPHARHAVLVHMPIALSMLTPLVLLVLAFTGFRNRTLQGVSLAFLLLSAIGAGLAANAGEAAEDSLHQFHLVSTDAASAALERHEELADGGWKWPLIPAAFLLVCIALPKKPAVRLGAGSLALLASVGVAAWIAMAAHAGGALVYDYGLGAPSPNAPTAAADPSTTAPAARDGDDNHDHDD